MGDLLNARLASHGKPFIAGDKITLADFSIAGLYFSQYYNDMSVFKQFGLHDKVRDVINGQPQLKAYLEGPLKRELTAYCQKREKCPF